jgi:hypothetical protein
MSGKLDNGTIVFGDGTTQSTKTPTNVSAFSNDSGYTTLIAQSPTYSKIGETGNHFTWGGSGMALTLYYYDINNNLIGTMAGNCNCNC